MNIYDKLPLTIHEVEDIRALHMAHADHLRNEAEPQPNHPDLPQHLEVIKRCNSILDFLNDLKRAWSFTTA